MDTVFVIMLKDKKTGFLEKELGSLSLTENDNYIVNMFVMEQEQGEKLYIRLSTGRDVADWEYSAIYDYYDSQALEELGAVVEEADDDYNPVWQIVIDYNGDMAETEKMVSDILLIHHNEMVDVFEAIKDKESEYTNEE